MQFTTLTSLLSLLALTAAAPANQLDTRNNHHAPVTHHVQVGGANIFAYTPSFVFAMPGDTIEFDFRQLNHTVTQSTFDEPCKRLDGGFDSDFQPNREGTPGAKIVKYTVPEKLDKPLWFYCRQGKHCSVNGMVFAINPTVEKDFTAFFNNAKKSQQ